MTETDPEVTSDLRRVLHRWFVQYNPLFFASALSLLGGLFVLSDGLGWASKGAAGDLWLTGVLVLYRWSLIGAAGLLLRQPGQTRPAVILAILEVVFLADVTLQIEALASLDGPGRWVTGLYAISCVLELRALTGIFGLRLNRAGWSLAGAGFGAVALWPHLARLATAEGAGPTGRGLLLMAVVFGVGAVALRTRAEVTARSPLNEWGQTVLRRSVRATWAIWGTLGLLHLSIAARLSLPIPVIELAIAGLALLALGRDDTEPMFVRLAIALGIAVYAGGPYLAATLALVSAVTFVRGSFARPERWVVSVLSTYAAGWGTLAWFAGDAAQPLGIVLLALLALVPLAWKTRAWTPSLATAFVLLHYGHHLGLVREPRTTAEWGMSLLAAAFVLLAVGVTVNLRAGRHAEPAPDPG